MSGSFSVCGGGCSGTGVVLVPRLLQAEKEGVAAGAEVLVEQQCQPCQGTGWVNGSSRG